MESIAAIEHELPMSGTATPLERPLRVLHVASGDLWAGAEAQIYTLLRTLASQFAEVQVAAALMNEGELAERLRRCGIEVHTFDESRLGSVGILMGLLRLMRSWRPDIVHTHRTKENVLAALANRMAGRVPSVKTVHGASERASDGVRGLREALISRFDLWCTRMSERCTIAVSAELASHLARIFPTERIAVIENGVDVAEARARIHPVDFRSRAPGDVHVGLVGRLVPVKRVDLFISMASELRRLHPQTAWHFHVFGDGPLRGMLESQARLDNDARVIFHGHRSDIIACLAGLDVLVMCSDHEGMPMTVLESLAVGTPIAAHAAGGLVDALAGTESAILVRRHDATGYADAVEYLASRRLCNLRENAVPERFTATRNAAKTCALYRDLLKLKGRAVET